MASEQMLKIGMELARKFFEKRGNNSEAHIGEAHLAAVLTVAAERGEEAAKAAKQDTCRISIAAQVVSGHCLITVSDLDSGKMVQKDAGPSGDVHVFKIPRADADEMWRVLEWEISDDALRAAYLDDPSSDPDL